MINKLLIIFFALVLASSAQTFTSIKSNEASAATTSIATSATMAVSSGDFIVACVGDGDNTTAINGLTVSDGGSNTLTCEATNHAGAPGNINLCYKANATANASATWTATWTNTHPFRAIMVANYSGMATASVLDQGPTCTPAGCTTASTGSGRSAVDTSTTTNASDLLVGCVYQDNTSNFSSANSYNLRMSATAVDVMLADKNVSATGAYPGGNYATVAGSGCGTTCNYVAAFAAFKAAAGGGATAARRRIVNFDSEDGPQWRFNQ